MIYWNFPCVSLVRPRFFTLLFRLLSPCLPEEAAQKYRPGTFVPDDKKEIRVPFFLGCQRWRLKSFRRFSREWRSCTLKEGNGMMKLKNTYWRKLSRTLWLFINLKALCLVGGDLSIFLGEFLFIDLMLLGILEIRSQILHVWKLKVGEILQFTKIFGHSDERLFVFDHLWEF